ncbi:MAG: DNA methyltransferase [Pyrinomonadaceae bacterium]
MSEQEILMPKFNDIELDQWRECDINTDSLWLIGERTKTGKHKNIYHGNFIPQIPNQLVRRYTKADEVVFEPFAGSGTTLFECEELGRRYIGLDINPEMIDYIESTRDRIFGDDRTFIEECDSTDAAAVESSVGRGFKKLGTKGVQFVLMHPPYLDIVKFTDKNNDLSHIADIKIFLEKLKAVSENSLQYLEKNRYFGIVLGDVYKNSEVIPLSFYCMDMIKRNFRVRLKGIIVKNIEGNRGKIGQNSIWKIRALKSDYFIFKHEYIFVFKKEF